MNVQLGQPGMLGKKLGMTQVFLEDGTRVPVTVVSIKGNTVLGHRTTERDGYTALQIGFEERKPARFSKPHLGQFKAAGVSPRCIVKEFRVPPEELAKYPVGSDLPFELFAEGASVDVTGTTKGKGFQGVMKRHRMGGKPGSHGVHEYFRHGGSIGCRLTPGRVHAGKRMPGQMGSVQQTLQNVRVARIMKDEGVLLLRGAVPGSAGSFLTVRLGLKAAIRQAHAAARVKK